MNISIFTDEICLDVARALELARGWGLSHVELRSLPSGRFPRVPDSEIQDFRKQLADAGLALSGVSPGFFKCALDDPTVPEDLTDSLPRACEWALELGTDRVSSFAFKRGDGDVPGEVIDRMSEMARIVAANGCRLSLENEASCWGNTGVEAVDILRQVGDDEVRLCYDPGNSANSGIAAPFPEEYRQVSDLVDLVHMKNYDAENSRWSLLEAGTIDWKGQLQALRADGFDSFVIVETHTDIAIEEFTRIDAGTASIDTSGLALKEANSLRNLEFVRACLSGSS